MTRGFEAVCTNDEAREHFKECGLTYSGITEGDILSLALMINRELKKSNKIGETSVNTMSLSKKIDITKNTNGTIKSCFLYLSSHYFTRREAISFNQDGFIGFAGWADDGNLNPLKRAFLAWCDELKSERDGKKMNDSFELTLNNPLTKEDWDKITDVELENTPSITFQTPKGKQVKYIKSDILDKIRAEIDRTRFIDKDTRHCRNALASGLEVALQIIDKYKAESEDKDD